MIVLHLGNGASASAVAGGRSVDTSMGLTPLEGLVMGTRSGDLDPAVVFHLRRARARRSTRSTRRSTRRSGLLALAGDNDLREVHRRIDAGDERAALALDVYCHRIRKYVGAYIAVLGRVDAVVFTAGVGENDAVVRGARARRPRGLGIAVDPRAQRRAVARGAVDLAGRGAGSPCSSSPRTRSSRWRRRPRRSSPPREVLEAQKGVAISGLPGQS